MFKSAKHFTRIKLYIHIHTYIYYLFSQITTHEYVQWMWEQSVNWLCDVVKAVDLKLKLTIGHKQIQYKRELLTH